MKIRISKRFTKDMEKIADQRILAKVRRVLEEVSSAQSISDVADMEEMAERRNFYRIKFDYRYRIGIYWDQDAVQFLRIGARGDFYKNFP